MNKLQKKRLRIISGALLFLLGLVLELQPSLEFLLFLIAYLITGYDIVYKAVRNILRGQVFDENFLMSIATIGAFLIGDFPEGVGVMLFYQVGELFQSYAVNQSRKSIASLMDIRPDYANLKRGDQLETVDPDEVAIDDIIVVKAGEKIPLDGIILEGYSSLDTSALTGESLPREVSAGMDVVSGCININGLLTIRVTKEFGESTVSKILDLVENAASKKAKTEDFITKFARYYTPAVVVLAAIIAVVPPLVLPDATFAEWIYRGLTFLVISCPCALVISIPLGFFGGIGGASKKGILVKGSNYLEALTKAELVVFDKTGTLTKGVFQVTQIHALIGSEADLLETAAYAESYSNHPISLSLKQAYGKEIDAALVSNVEEIAGHGVQAVVKDHTILAGNAKLMIQHQIPYISEVPVGTIVHVAVDGVYHGYLVIADELKEDAQAALQALKQEQIQKTVMLTGDSQAVGSHVAQALGLDSFFAELLPADKVTKVEELFQTKSASGKLVFVGDGINDAPVLARADIGIAMGGLGSDAAIEAADIVIMTDEPSKIATAIRIAKRTIRIVNQNIIFSLGVKAGVLILAAMGYAPMWAGVLADVGVTILAVLNASRALRVNSL